MKTKPKLLFITAFLLSSLLFVPLISQTINWPYVGPNATSFNLYSLIAHNYNRFGFLKSSLAPIVSVADQLPAQPKYYLHHPPLTPIILSLAFKFFGETFFIGRLTMIFFAIGSLLLISLISLELTGLYSAIISMFVHILIPASSVFGRMIGQETILLFFLLLLTYLAIKLKQRQHHVYLASIYLTTILATLTDWPMTYFSISIAPWLISTKQKKLSTRIISITILSILVFLAYILWLTGSLTELFQALSNRSLGGLLAYKFWGVKWLLTTTLRLLIYFNPLVVILSLYYLIKHQKKSYLILGFLAFGLIHLFLYLEGSFSHPYWTYYLLPFFVLSSTKVISQTSRKTRYWFAPILILAAIFSYKIINWKTEQIANNLWRYDLAKAASTKLKKFSQIAINPNVVIDPDMLEYQFQLNPVQIPSPDLSNFAQDLNHYFYFCTDCRSTDKHIAWLVEKYHSTEISSSPGKLFIFNLHQPPLTTPQPNNSQPPSPPNSTTTPTSQTSLPKSIYRWLKQTLQLHQL